MRDFGGLYVYGEQDFLNHFWGRLYSYGSAREILSRDHFHCLAEDFGHEHRLPRDKSTHCKVVEFSSCRGSANDGGTGVKWKPWMDSRILLSAGNVSNSAAARKICRNVATDEFWQLTDLWESFYREAEAAVASSFH